MAATLLDFVAWWQSLRGPGSPSRLRPFHFTSRCRSNRRAELTAREWARCLVFGSLVNAFTNYRDVKRELRQKPLHVTDVTHGSSAFCLFLRTPHHNSV